MNAVSRRVKAYIEQVKKEKSPSVDKEKRIKAAFNRAANLVKALEALEEQTQGRIKIYGKRLAPCSLDDVWISTNVPDAETVMVHKNLRFISSGSPYRESPHFSTIGIKNHFAVKRAVKFVARQAKKHGMI